MQADGSRAAVRQEPPEHTRHRATRNVLESRLVACVLLAL